MAIKPPGTGKVLQRAPTGISVVEGAKDFQSGADLGDVEGYKRNAADGGFLYNRYTPEDFDFRLAMQGLQDAGSPAPSAPPTTAPPIDTAESSGGRGFSSPDPIQGLQAAAHPEPIDTGREDVIQGLGALRQGLGQRTPLQLSNALAGLRRIY